MTLQQGKSDVHSWPSRLRDWALLWGQNGTLERARGMLCFDPFDFLYAPFDALEYFEVTGMR